MEEIIKEKVSNRERSAAYPGVTIQDIIEFVTKIYKMHPSANAKFTRQDIADLTNKSKSTLIPLISAALQYGLLIAEKEKETFSINHPLFKSVYMHLTDEEKYESLLRLFLNPKLNASLFEKYNGYELPSTDDLKKILFRTYRITEKAAPEAAEIFIENARFVGILNSDNILSATPDVTGIETKNNLNGEPVVFKGVDDEKEKERIRVAEEQKKKQQLLLAQMNNSENEIIKLTEGKYIDITCPLDINTTDFEIFELWVKQLGLRRGVKNKSTP